MQIRGHYDAGAEVNSGWEGGPVGEMVRQDAHRDLTLAMRLLIDGRGDRSFLEIGRHLGEEVCGYQLYFSRQTTRS